MISRINKYKREKKKLFFFMRIGSKNGYWNFWIDFAHGSLYEKRRCLFVIHQILININYYIRNTLMLIHTCKFYSPFYAKLKYIVNHFVVCWCQECDLKLYLHPNWYRLPHLCLIHNVFISISLFSLNFLFFFLSFRIFFSVPNNKTCLGHIYWRKMKNWKN